MSLHYHAFESQAALHDRWLSFISSFSFFSPCACSLYIMPIVLGPKFYPGKNKTLIGLVSINNKEPIENISYIFYVVIPFSSFAIVVVCTITPVVKLGLKTKCREGFISSEQSSQFKSFFIVCFFLFSAMLLAMVVQPELSIYGRQRNTFFTVCNIFCFLPLIDKFIA